MAIDEGGSDFAVGAGDNDDAIFGVIGHLDLRDAGGAGDPLYSRRIDGGLSEIVEQGLAEYIFAHHAHHCDGIAEPGDGDGLVGAFAAGRGFKP